jgi:hypothetical protein
MRADKGLDRSPQRKQGIVAALALLALQASIIEL